MSADSPLHVEKRAAGWAASWQAPFDDMVWIPGGPFLMGSNDHYPEEAPAHPVAVSGFWMDRFAVTNAGSAVCRGDGLRDGRRAPRESADYPGAKPELLEPAAVVFRKTARPVDLRNPYNWWTYVRGADWRHPRGPGAPWRGSGTIR